MIVYKLKHDGGFLAGCTETGIAAYAYPTSTHATHARKRPDIAAAAMIAGELRAPRDHERDARWIAELTAE